MGSCRRFILLSAVVGLGAFAAVADLYGQAQPRPQAPVARPNPNTPPPQGTSRGENFSNKQPSLLFASDCTGAGCHRSPQGLAKGQGAGSLASFLREHYTNSRESAAALAGYLLGNPSAVVRPPPELPGARARSAARPDEPPKPGETQRPTEAARPPDEAGPPGARGQRPGPTAPSNARAQRGRQAAMPPPAPEPPPPPQPQFDIFD